MKENESHPVLSIDSPSKFQDEGIAISNMEESDLEEHKSGKKRSSSAMQLLQRYQSGNADESDKAVQSSSQLQKKTQN